MSLPNYQPRISLQSRTGLHIRYIPSTLAHAMVLVGSAAPLPSGGRTRAVTLSRAAEGYAQRIGPPSDARPTGVKFTRRVHLDNCATRTFEHHPRCLYIDCDAD